MERCRYKDNYTIGDIYGKYHIYDINEIYYYEILKKAHFNYKEVYYIYSYYCSETKKMCGAHFSEQFNLIFFDIKKERLNKLKKIQDGQNI